jgi:hypothetical protein
LTVVTFEIEHILPLSLSGETVLVNLCLACPTCNRYKADRTVGFDQFTAQDVPLFHPQRNSWSEHFAWTEKGDVVVGLTSTGRATVDMLRMNRPQLVRVRRMWVIMGEHPPNLG